MDSEVLLVILFKLSGEKIVFVYLSYPQRCPNLLIFFVLKHLISICILAWTFLTKVST